MKSKVLSFGMVFSLVLLSSAWAADILGTWIAKIPEGSGTIEPLRLFQDSLGMVETTFSFKAAGTKLTGTVSDLQGKTAISEGEINGDEISFVAMGKVGGNRIALVYKGKVGLNEINFTRAPKDGTGQPLEFIATREFLRHNDYIPRPISVPVQPPPSR
jgi:hypothetical protein